MKVLKSPTLPLTPSMSSTFARADCASVGSADSTTDADIVSGRAASASGSSGIGVGVAGGEELEA